MNSLLRSLAKNSSTHQGKTDSVYLMESHIKSGSELHISHADTRPRTWLSAGVHY